MAARLRPLRLEAFGTHRSPSRLLPATSIFSALGDIPSDTVGLQATWLAAPRLAVLGSVAARWAGDDLGADAWVRTTLRLDEGGEGTMSIEARRFGVPPDEWTGLRLRGRFPLVYGIALGTEVEIARPDDPDGRGALWPWGLVSLGGEILEHWEAAVGVEALASPQKTHQIAGLARLSYQWGAP